MEERALLTLALLVEALALVWLAKQLWGVVLKRDVDQELTTHDNPAAANVYRRVGFQGLAPDAPRPDGVEDWLELGFRDAELGHW